MMNFAPVIQYSKGINIFSAKSAWCFCLSAHWTRFFSDERWWI